MIANIKFDEDHKNSFQIELGKTVREIKKSKEVFLMADKTTNIYKVKPELYQKLLTETITKDYKHTPSETVNNINREAKGIAEKLKLEDRIEQYTEGKAFITLKDHKDNFMNNPKFRLINPAKSNIGKISSQILKKINQEVRNATGLNQWQSTKAVTDWFNQIKSKTKKRFMQLDIVEFYPSISEALLNTALDFASRHTAIPEEEARIIKHSRKALLFSQQDRELNHWTKKDGLFDVTMGAPDGAEVCELVGLFMLDQVRNKFKELDFGLYRDDGLAEHRRIPGPRLDRIRKEMIELFKSNGLRITIEMNCTRADFLDVTLDLSQEKYQPYKKPNDRPLYVNTKSNHPPTVIKQIPISINKRLCSIASNEEDFKNAIPEYQEALKNSGYNHTLSFNRDPAPPKDQENEKRKRLIIWYNPPFNLAVKTKIGKTFLALIDKNFPKGSPLSSVVNRNNTKLSYSCTKNMKDHMAAHNAKILQPQTPRTTATCNCRKKAECPLQGACQQAGIYKATLENGKFYIGSTIDFKKRFNSHTHSFRHEEHKNSTTLSHHIWETQLQPSPKINWQIVKNTPVYKKGGRECDLCLTEKLFILKNISDPNLLNRNTDLALKCKHRARHRLSAL